MKYYTFRVRDNEFECIAPSIESAYRSAEEWFAYRLNWTGKITFVSSKDYSPIN